MVMGGCIGHLNLPDGDFLSTRVSVNDRHAKPVFAPSFL